MFFLTEEWNEQFGHLPWYRRYEFLVPGLVVLVGLLFFLTPVPGKPDGFVAWLRILLAYFLFFGWVLLVLSDKESLCFSVRQVGPVMVLPRGMRSLVRKTRRNS